MEIVIADNKMLVEGMLAGEVDWLEQCGLFQALRDGRAPTVEKRP
jgi:hypothetical protein